MFGRRLGASSETAVQWEVDNASLPSNASAAMITNVSATVLLFFFCDKAVIKTSSKSRFLEGDLLAIAVVLAKDALLKEKFQYYYYVLIYG